MKKVIKWFFIVMAVMFVGSFLYVATLSEEDMANIDKERKEKAYNQFQKDSLRFCTDATYSAEQYAQNFIKDNLRDPQSFVAHKSKTVYNKNRNLYVTDLDYGAKNGFGGMVRKRCLIYVKHTAVFDTIAKNGKYYQSVENIEEFN